MVFTIISTMAGFMLGTLLQPAVAPISDIAAQYAYMQAPYRAPDISAIIEIRRKGFMDKKAYHHYAKRLGYENQVSDALYKSTTKMLDVRELVLLHRRDQVKDFDYPRAGKMTGYTPDQIMLIERAMEYYPNAQDFIRFAVRDTFNDDIVQKYGYDEDYPITIDDDVKKAGMSPEWMRHFWRAHWVLPSVQQAYEMLHRGEIDKKTLNELLKISDIPKYWRDKLIKVSYNPFTRVDIRRMYKIGVLNAEQVLTSYKDIGYDDEKAEILRDFTIKYALEEPKTLAESKIRDSFLSGKIDETETKSMLSDLGYDAESVDFVYALWIDDKYEIELSSEIENIKVSFLYGDITENQLTDSITALGLPSDSIKQIITDIINTKKRMKQLPTKSDIIRWYNGKIIDEDQFKKLLKQLGYGDMFINNYLLETNKAGAEEFRVPTKADYLAFWKGQIIDTQDWVNGMFALGYNDTDITRYAALYNIDLEVLKDVSEEET